MNEQLRRKWEYNIEMTDTDVACVSCIIIIIILFVHLVVRGCRFEKSFYFGNNLVIDLL